MKKETNKKDSKTLAEPGPKRGRPRTAPEGYRPFRQAKMFAQRQKLSTEKQWHEYARTAKCPKDIPSYPDRVYGRELWEGWGDWLGVGILPYEEAKAVVGPYQIQSPTQYEEKFSELFPRPRIISRDPDQYYGSGFKGWADYLGVSELERAPRPDQEQPECRANSGEPFRPYMEAVKLVARVGLRDRNEWMLWRRTYRYPDLPWNPEVFYGSEWSGWSVFLGHDPLPGLLSSVGVLYVGRDQNEPTNVYRVQIHHLGKTDLMQKAAREGFKVVRMWKYEPEMQEEVRVALAANCSGWYGSDAVFLVPNIYGLFADLFNLLQVVVP